MRALYAVQQHVALCGVECKTLLVVAVLFVVGLTGSQLRAESLPYDEAFYAAEDAAPEPASPAVSAAFVSATATPADPDSMGVGEHEAAGDTLDPAEPTLAEAEASPRMNLNAASARLLTQLPGIGPKKAEAVVAYRDEHGAFASVDELQRVRGIGPKTVAKLAPLLFVESPVAAPAPVPSDAIAAN